MSDAMETVVRRKPGRPPRGDRPDPRQARTVRESEDFGEFSEFENHSVLPNVPDTREWHYCWVRVSVQGAADGKNLVKHLNGTVRYEPVPASEMPGLLHFRATNAINGSGADIIQVDDVVLMRCSRATHEKQLRYYDHRAGLQRQALKAKTNDELKDSRIKVTYEDEEKTTVEMVGGGGE